MTLEEIAVMLTHPSMVEMAIVQRMTAVRRL